MSFSHLTLVILAAALGGAMNSIAGGGTLVTFPAIVWLGVPPIIANATSAVGLWPAAAGSIWGYRRLFAGGRFWVLHFTLPSLAGGGAGAWLLLHTPAARFAKIVPFLVLGATTLFIVQQPLMRLLSRRGVGTETHAEGGWPSPTIPLSLLYPLQFAIGIYGGYFGAGNGILMLAVMGLIGLTSIHRMNGLKNWAGLCMNAVAATSFAIGGLVDWPVAFAMAAGALVGGYGGARVAQRVGQAPVRRTVVLIGLVSFVWLLLRRG
ncbi:MAG: sulfite exporter TauE/SafE family protein [Gemmatimonadales bacterium]